MALTHLLDTSVLCQPIKDRPHGVALDRWSALGDAAVGTSSVCLAEVLQGLEVRRSDKYWRRYRALIEDRYPVLPFDAMAAAVFGGVAGALKRVGRPRPIMDLLIAATALHHGLAVATLNPKDFEGIPGLRVEDWSAGGIAE